MEKDQEIYIKLDFDNMNNPNQNNFLTPLPEH